MDDLIRKLSSRKLWMAIAGVATGIALIQGTEPGEINQIAGAVTSLISAITYIIIEGKVDAESVKNTIIEIEEAKDVFDNE